MRASALPTLPNGELARRLLSGPVKRRRSRGQKSLYASSHACMPSNILECFPLRSFCRGNTTFIFRCHVTSKEPIEGMRLRYIIARDALIVKGNLSGVDMSQGVVSYLHGLYRYVPPDRVWFFRVTILREGIISPFVGIVVHV